MDAVVLFLPINQDVSFTATSCNTFEFTIRFLGTIKVEWGDGTEVIVDSSNQATDRVFTKTYSSAFTGTIKIKGNTNRVNTFTSLSNTGIRINLLEFWKFKDLVDLQLLGNCFINNTISEIPRVTSVLALRELPNLVMSGVGADLPRATLNLRLRDLPNFTVTSSNSLDLPRVTNILELTNVNINMSGTIANLPRVTSNFTLFGLNGVSISGNGFDLPRVTANLTLVNLPNLTLTGNGIDLPRVTSTLNLQNCANITLTTTALDLPRVTSTLILSNLPNLVISGNASNLPLARILQIQLIGNSTLSYTAGTTQPTIKERTLISISTRFTTGQTDAMLNDYATFSTTWSSTSTIFITLTSLGRTSASDVAVTTLNYRGVTITLIP